MHVFIILVVVQFGIPAVASAGPVPPVPEDCKLLPEWAFGDVAQVITAAFRFAATIDNCPIPNSFTCFATMPLCEADLGSWGDPPHTCAWEVLMRNLSHVATQHFAADAARVACKAGTSLFCNVDAASAFSCRATEAFAARSRFVAAAVWAPLAAATILLLAACLLLGGAAWGDSWRQAELSERRLPVAAGKDRYPRAAAAAPLDRWDLRALRFYEQRGGVPAISGDEVPQPSRPWSNWDA